MASSSQLQKSLQGFTDLHAVSVGLKSFLGAGVHYTVAPGDNLSKIAHHFGIDVAALAKHNGIRDANRIKLGQSLHIPLGEARISPENGELLAPLFQKFDKEFVVTTRSVDGHRVFTEDSAYALQQLGIDPLDAGKRRLADLPALIEARAKARGLATQHLGLGARSEVHVEKGEVRGNDAKPSDFEALIRRRGAGERFPPGSEKAVALFREGIEANNERYRETNGRHPVGWHLVPENKIDQLARSPGLHKILARESNGVVGRPNYTYGPRAKDQSRWNSIYTELEHHKIRARSTATGLGQLLGSNVDIYYPQGRAGLAVPRDEAAGMLAYIVDRYRTPERAWARYGDKHEGY